MKHFIFALMLLLVFCVGCGNGEVSPKTYEFAQSLYNISNRKLTDKLESITEQVETAQVEGEISLKEAKWLNAIVKKAEREEWQQAMKDARQMMEEQIVK